MPGVPISTFWTLIHFLSDSELCGLVPILYLTVLGQQLDLNDLTEVAREERQSQASKVQGAQLQTACYTPLLTATVPRCHHTESWGIQWWQEGPGRARESWKRSGCCPLPESTVLPPFGFPFCGHLTPR